MLDQNGHEIPDATPVARPLKISTRPSSLDELKQLLRIVSREAEQSGTESFEEAEDFDVGDDSEPYSRWEIPSDEDLQGFVEQLRAERNNPPPESAPLGAGAPASGVPPSPPGNAPHVPPAPVQAPATS